MSELTWPRMVHAFIARYLTDDHVKTACESVTRTVQQPEEPEDGFAQRIERNAADCCQIFKEHELLSYFIQGLFPRIRYTVAEQMKNFVEQERGSMLTARCVAAAEGRSVRARFGDPGGRMRPIRSRDTTTTGGTRRASQKLVPTMYAGPGMDLCDSRGVRSSTTERTDRVADFWETVMPANPLKKCCGRQDAHIHAPVTGITPPSSGGSTAQTIDVTACNGQPRVPPVLTEEQMRQAWLVVPGDKAMYSCWACRTGEHSLLTCPYISAHARAFFAYRSYSYQTGASAQMPEYLRRNEGRHPQAEITKAPSPAEVPTKLPAPPPPVHGRWKFQDRGPPRQDKHVRFKSRQGIHVMPQYPTGLPPKDDVHGEGGPSGLNWYSVQDDAYSGPSTSTGTSSSDPLND